MCDKGLRTQRENCPSADFFEKGCRKTCPVINFFEAF